MAFKLLTELGATPVTEVFTGAVLALPLDLAAPASVQGFLSFPASHHASSVLPAAGGGAQNPQWTAIRQRVLGVPVKPSPQTEAAYGAAILARQAAQKHAGAGPAVAR